MPLPVGGGIFFEATTVGKGKDNMIGNPIRISRSEEKFPTETGKGDMKSSKPKKILVIVVPSTFR